MSLPKVILKTARKVGSADAMSALGVASQSALLPFFEETQEQDQWCWAAVLVSVSHFYDSGTPWTQCSLVNAELNRNDCCGDGGTPGCNRPWTLNRPLARTQNLNFMSGSPADIATLHGEIDGTRPVGCRIGWTAGGGHFVVVHGYSEDETGSWVSVADPLYGPSTYTYDAFRTSYRNSGRWTNSYFTQPAP